MKNKVYIIIIVCLVFLISIVRYVENNASKSKSSTNVAEANSVNSSFDEIKIPDLTDYIIAKIPEKKSGVKDPNIYAKNYILIDADNKYPLAKKGEHEQVPIASTTKIMTAIIVFENYNLSDIIEISKHAAAQIGSDVYLQTGEKVTVNNLLHALLIQSGNDAAMALAENMKNGGETEFVRKMNEKAKLLGMNDTNYKDPAGLDDTGKSSAFDLAIATSYALNNLKTFGDIIKKTEYSFTSSDSVHRLHELKTSNRLIDSNQPLYMDSAIGVKTGYTPDAGHCLISAVKKGKITLVGVILNTVESKNDSSARESKKLLEWGMESYNF